MFTYIWHTVFFDPIYNTLVFFIDTVRSGDVGLAIIATVIVVKMVLLPLSIKAAKTQKIMRDIEPKLKAIKERFKDDKEGQAKAMMLVYKDAKLNPFASVFLVFLQIPIIIALYYAVSKGGGVHLPGISTDLLYSFIHAPTVVTMHFLGLIDISARSLGLAICAGVSQYIFTAMTLPKMAPKVEGATADFKEDFMRNMQLQMKFVMPVLIGFIAYTLSAAIALYFMVSNLVAIAQEFYIRKHR
jgi:YidC/Oxa1 family membrane protein insertase